MSLTVPVADLVAESNDPRLATHSSWERIHLKDMASILNGFAFKSRLFSKTEGMPLIRIRDVGTSQTVSRFTGEYDPRYVVEPADLIVGMDGEFKCARWTGPSALLNQRVCKIEVTTKGYEPRLLDFALPGYLDAIRDRTSSVTVTHLSSRDMGEIPLPLPPLVEQKRIVAKVEALLARVNAARERLAKVPAILKRFRQSVLAAACSGRLTEDWREEHRVSETAKRFVARLTRERRELWEQRELRRLVAKGKPPNNDRWRGRYRDPFEPAPLNDMPEKWAAATTSHVALLDVGHAFRSSEFSDEGIRLLRGENLEPGSLRWVDARFWPLAKLDGFEHLLVEEGEIILAMDRPLISGGLKIARTTTEDVPCLLVQRMTRFKMVDPALTGFLYLCLQREEFIGHLSHGLTGSDLPHITGTGVAEYTFALPPMAEQREIVRRVEALFKIADAIEKRVAGATARAEKLTQSVLAKAFRGELVPTEAELARREGRDYEPASVLLERILAEREAAGPAPRKKRAPRRAASGGREQMTEKRPEPNKADPQHDGDRSRAQPLRATKSQPSAGSIDDADRD